MGIIYNLRLLSAMCHCHTLTRNPTKHLDLHTKIIQNVEATVQPKSTGTKKPKHMLGPFYI